MSFHAWRVERSVMWSLFWIWGVQCRDAAVDMHLAGIQLYDAMQHFQFSCSVCFSCCHGNKAPFSHLCHQCTFHYGQGDQIASPAVYATFVCVSVCVRLFDWLHPSIVHLQLRPGFLSCAFRTTFLSHIQTWRESKPDTAASQILHTDMLWAGGRQWSKASHRWAEREKERWREGEGSYAAALD